MHIHETIKVQAERATSVGAYGLHTACDVLQRVSLFSNIHIRLDNHLPEISEGVIAAASLCLRCIAPLVCEGYAAKTHLGYRPTRHQLRLWVCSNLSF